MPQGDFHAGYAQRVITPPLDPPVYLAGFGQNRVAKTIHDDLYARALALQMGETTIALVALDLLGLARNHCLEIEARVKQSQPNIQLIIAARTSITGRIRLVYGGRTCRLRV